MIQAVQDKNYNREALKEYLKRIESFQLEVIMRVAISKKAWEFLDRLLFLAREVEGDAISKISNGNCKSL